MNKKSMIKIGVVSLVLAIIIIFIIIILNSHFTYAGVLTKNEYIIGESVKINFIGKGNYEAKIITPSTSYLRVGSNDVFLFNPEEIGNYTIELDIGGEISEYNFEALKKEETNETSEFEFYNLENLYYLNEEIGINLVGAGAYEAIIRTPSKNISRLGSNDYFRFIPEEIGDYRLELIIGGNKKEYNFTIVNKLWEYSNESENITIRNDVQAIVGKPYKKIIKINISELNSKIDIPYFSENISVYKFTSNGKEKIYFELKKQSFIDFIKNLFFVKKEKTIVLNNISGEIEIDYYTEGPKKQEKKKSFNKKEVVVFSSDNLSYENVLAYSDLPILTKNKKSIKIYWKEEDKYIDFEAYDKNNDGFLDYIEWIVPHLSEQTFEISIQILNVQSYPPLYGNWVVEFNTIGKADLIIRAFNGTTWSNSNEDNQLKFLEIKCGNNSLDYQWINNSVFIHDYECNETGYEISKELVTGKKILEFNFGGEVAYAYNDIQNVSLMLFWNGTTIPTDWTCISCASSDPFYQRFPRGSGTYGTTGGANNHNHTNSSAIWVSNVTANVSRAGTGGDKSPANHSHTISSFSVSNESNIPSYRNLKVIRFNYGIPNIIPAGAIAIFNSTPPSGWSNYTLQNNYFIRGENNTNTGGSNTHNHSVSITITDPYPTQASSGSGNGLADDPHDHSVTNNKTQDEDNRPPYINVILAIANSDTTIPVGMIGMFNATPPATHLIVMSDTGGVFNNRTIVGSSTFGATGGNEFGRPSNVSFITEGPTSTTTDGSGSAQQASNTHTHTINISFSNSSYMPPYINVIFAYVKNSSFDTTPPYVNIVYPQNTNYSINVSNLNYSVSDLLGVSRCWYSNSSGVWNSTTISAGTNFTNVVSIEGWNNWTLYCNDTANNQNKSSVRFFKDTVYPGINIVTPANSTNTTNVNLNVNYTFFDANTQSCWWTNNSGVTNFSLASCGINITGKTWPEGKNNIIVYINDTLGNTNKTSVTFTLDTIYPKIQFGINTEINASNFSRNWIYVNVSVNETNEANITYTLYNTTGQVNITTFYDQRRIINWTNLPEGRYYYNVTVRDYVNNINFTETRVITLDRTNPLIQFGTGTETNYSSFNRTWIYVNVSVTETNEANITFSLYNTTRQVNATTFTNLQRTINWTGLPNGIYFYNVSIADYVNRINFTETRVNILDSFNPNGTLLTPANNTYTNNVSQNLTVNASDNIRLSNVSLFVYNSTGNLINQTDRDVSGTNAIVGIIYTFLYDGIFKWFYKITDIANNYFYTQNNTITIDTTFPVIYIVYPQNISYPTNVSELNYSVSDNNASRCWYSRNNGITNSSSVSAGINFTSVTSINGSNNWTVYCNDSVGNTNSSIVFFYKYVAYPQIRIITPLNATNTTDVNINVNYTYYDINVSSCWWTNNSGVTNNSITCGNNLTGITWPQGLNTVIIYINNTLGNTNSSSVSFTVDTISPVLNIVYPLNTTYNVNVSTFNYSVIDDRASRCWHSRNNGITNSSSVSAGINFTSVQSIEGNNNWTVYCNDTVGNINSSIVYFFKDSIYPQIRIVTPLNGTNITDTGIDVNYSYVEANPDKCWWTYNNGEDNETITCGTNITWITWPQGLTTVIIYTNDTLGNFNLSRVSFTVDTISPVLNIVYPLNTTYNVNVSTFNYSISDVSASRCWHSRNNGITNSSSVSAGINFTSVQSIEESNNWTLYCNDSVGNVNWTRVFFFKDTIFPNATLLNPLNNTLNSTVTHNFTVNATDSMGLSNSTLFIYNSSIYNSTYLVNQTSRNISGTNAIIGIVYTFLYDGVFKWFYMITDIANNQFFTSNYTITLDANSPFLRIVYPLNTTYFNNISQLNYAVDDVTASRCWYSRDNGITNSTSVAAGENFTNVISVPETNKWTLYCNDSFGRVNFTSVTFYYEYVYAKTITVENVTSNSVNTANSITFQRPANARNGDVLFAFVAKDDDPTTSPPSGWTQILTRFTTSGDDLGSGSWYKIITNISSETSSYTWTGDNEQYSGGIMLLRGVNLTSVLDATPAVIQSTNNPNFTCPSIYTATDFALVFACGGVTYTGETISSSTPPAETTRQLTRYNLESSSFCSNYSQFPAGATGTPQWTNNGNAGSESHAYQIAFKPAYNVIPNVSNFGINSSIGSNATNQDLNCFGLLIDYNYDLLNASVRWYKNEILNLSFDFNNSYSPPYNFNIVLKSGNLTEGDVWSCAMRLYDGQEYSNWVYSPGITIVSDYEPPIIRIVYPANITYNVNVSTLNYTLTELNPDRCWYSKDNGITNSSPIIAGTNFTNVVSVDRNNTWTMWCNDTYGWVNKTSVSFFRDITMPNGTLLNPLNNTFNTTTTHNFTVNITDDIGLFNATLFIYNSSVYNPTYLVNQTNVSISGTNVVLGIVYTFLYDGLFKWFYRIADAANNIFYTQNYTITIDRAAPVILIKYPLNTTYSYNVTNMNYSYNDVSPGYCWWSNNSGIWNSSTVVAGTNWTGLSANYTSNTWTIWCNDTMGNINTSSVTFYRKYVYPSIITVENTTTGSNTAAAFVIIDNPANAKNGDVLFAFIVKDDDIAISGPSGWTQNTQQQTTAGNDFASGVWYKVITDISNEPSSYTWTSSTSEQWSGGIMLLRGVNLTNPFDATTVQNSGQNNPDPTCPSITVNTNGAMVFPCAGITLDGSSITTSTEPAGTTKQFGMHISEANSFCSNYSANAGATGTQQWNTDGAAEHEWHSYQIAFRPAINFPPNNPVVYINSTFGGNYSLEDLNCFAVLNDSNYDYLNLSLRWYKNGELNLSYDFNNSYPAPYSFNNVLKSGNLSGGDNWTCAMRLFDSIEYSEWAYSSAITILYDTEPPAIRITYPLNVSYKVNITTLNYTLQESNPSECWWSNNSGIWNSSRVPGYTNWTGLGSEEGINSWTVYCNDTYGQYNSTTLNFFVDSIYPLIEYGEGTNVSGLIVTRNWTYVNVTVVEANEANMTFTLYNSNGIVNRTYRGAGNRTFNWTNLADGIYYYNVTVTDVANNKNTTISRNITINFHPPTGILIPGNNSFFNNLTQNLTVNASDTIGLLNATLFVYNSTGNLINETNRNISGTNYLLGIIYTFLYDGMFKWFYRLVDISNNIFYTQNNTLTIDRTPPVINIVFPLNTSYTYNITTFNYTVIDVNASRCWYSNNSGAWNSTSVAAGINFTNMYNLNGANTWTLYCNDSAGNFNSSSVSFYANPPPQMRIIFPLSQYYNINITNLNYSISDASASRCWYSNNSGIWNSTSVAAGTNFTNAISVEGTNTWTLYCNDTENLVNSTNVTFIMDLTNPSITNVISINSSGVINGTINIGEDVRINATVTDNINVSNVWYIIWQGIIGSEILRQGLMNLITGNLWSILIPTNYTYPFGLVNYTVYANDSAGNQANYSSNFTTVDFILPNVYLINPANETSLGYGQSLVYFAANFSDNTYLKNATLYIWNSTGNIINFSSKNISGILNSTNMSTNFTYTDKYSWNYYACDYYVSCSWNNTNRTVIYDIINPLLYIVYPQYGNYTNNVNAINYSISDLNPSRCWYSRNNGVTNSSSVIAGNNFTGVTSVEGWNNWTLYCNDTSGNQNSSSVSFFKDSIAPIINITFPRNTSYDYTFSYLNYSYNDTNPGYCWYSNNSGITNSSSVPAGINFTNVGYSEGYNNWTVYCNDSLGNENKTRIFFIIDTIYPLINFGVGTQANYANVSKSNVYVNISVIENFEQNITFILYNSTGVVNITTVGGGNRTFNWSGLTDGIYYYNVSIRDIVNHYNYTETRTITLDSTYPNGTLLSPENNTITNVTGQNFTVNATDNIELDNVSLFIYNSSGNIINQTDRDITGTNAVIGIFYTFLYDGVFKWFYRITDIANNIFFTQNNTITIDTAYPLINFGYGTNINYANISKNFIYVNVTVNEINEANITFTLYNTSGVVNITTYTNKQRTINWTNLADGIYYYNVTVYDLINNYNSTEMRQITIDTTYPLISFGEGTSETGVNVSRNWIYINVSVVEINEANITFGLFNTSGTVNITTLAAGNRTINWTNLADGKYYYNVSIRDYSNNLNFTETRIITLDTTLPNGSLLTPLNNTFTYNVNQNLTVNASDNIELDNLTLFVYNESNDLINQTTGEIYGTRTIFGIVYTFLYDGVFKWFYKITDIANNLFFTSNYTITIDTIKPGLYIIYPLNTNYTTNVSVINYSYSDLHPDRCWYSNNSGIWNSSVVVAGTNFTGVTSVEGLNVWTVYCNDSAGNINSSNVSLFVDTIHPVINIRFPLNLSYNINVTTINYTYIDTNSGYCWYSNNSGIWNSSAVVAGTNFTNVVSFEGINSWTVYCNDSLGNENWTVVNFFKDTVYPLIKFGIGTPDDGYAAYQNWLYVNVSVIEANEQNITFTLYNLTGPVNITTYTNQQRTINWTNLVAGKYYYNVSITDVANNINFTETRSFNYSYYEFEINSSDIVFDIANPKEGETITINATIHNTGTLNGAVIVQFYKGDPDNGGIQIGIDKNISIRYGSQNTTSVIWNATLGTNIIYVVIDPPSSTNGSYIEYNESNNKAFIYINVDSWQYFYGDIGSDSRLGLLDNGSSSLVLWNLGGYKGNIYVSDYESIISWLDLKAIGKNSSGQNSTNDFSDVDKLFNMSNFTDSVYNTFTTNGQMKNYTSFSVFNHVINYVPIINSTNNTNFITGILWDSSDDKGDGELNNTGMEDIVFVTKINDNTQGRYGIYDYEMRVPAKLRDYYIADRNSVVFYLELT